MVAAAPERPDPRPHLQSAAPTIQVSIGRIEVKASLPPLASPRAPRPRGAVMSLEDYLRGREKGGGS
jgi:hypothetical protein